MSRPASTTWSKSRRLAQEQNAEKQAEAEVGGEHDVARDQAEIGDGSKEHVCTKQ